TMASTALLHALRAQGHTAVGMKPVASGCERTPQGWRNEDALALQTASAPQPDYATLNPYALPAPLAPELAAAEVGVTLSLEPIASAFAQLRAQAEVVVVEGVGGWAAPLSADLDQADLVRALALPVVLVVGIRLGCINHARLTAAAIAADGLDCIGWIANEVDPQMERIEENIGMLRQRLAMPCWGRIAWRPGADAAAQSLGLHVPV
ncbi:dethiobiotin synthase, partial [Xanthomonas arboricola]